MESKDFENRSRFNIKHKSKILEKYVIYCENLHVSFSDLSPKQKLKSEIRNTKKLISTLKDVVYTEKRNELKTKVAELTLKLKNKNNWLTVSDRLKIEKKLLKSKIRDLNSKQISEENNTKIGNLKKEIGDLNDELSEWKELKKNELHNEKKVLKGVSFGVKQGETLALVGANGAGKTVLIETLLGMNDAKKNSKMFLNLGEDTFEKNLKLVGIQYQNSKFPLNSRVIDVINYNKKFYKNIDHIELQNMIETFGLFDILNSKTSKLSGGQRQRLNLLLAIMHQPKLMILDEFITGLDVRTVRKIITYVSELKFKNNSTMIIISHQPEEIKELADRVIVMNNGSITIETTIPEILKKYKSVEYFLEQEI